MSTSKSPSISTASSPIRSAAKTPRRSWKAALGANGTVDANNLLLKCPSRYEEGIPKDYEEVKVEAVK